MKQRTTSQYLRAEQVVDLLLLNRDGRLTLTHTASGRDEWHVLPHGSRVRPQDVRQIIHRNDVVASADALLPGALPQTWRAR
jgi:hypothetical protein